MRLHAPPLDWTRGAGRPPQPRPDAVDVIIPVYGAGDELARCLESVVRCTDLARHGLLLVIDGPQDEIVEQAILLAPSARVLRNGVRLGFVGSVNRGMRATTGDVVLLNSDTIVTARWLEKLIDTAASSGDAGTVTPLSNHATLCSVPRQFEENLLPSGHDAASFGALVERVSLRSYPRLPTGVGVCFHIRRALLDEIGFFDEKHFGLGYGEENDFCMRALARGWLHLADDATFIEHAGHRSFRASRAQLQRDAARTLERLHPAYMPTIAAYMRADPLAPVRARIADALRPALARQPTRAPRRIVHVIHGWPPFQFAGTELYGYWLVQRQLQWRAVSVFGRFDDPGRTQGEAVELMDGGARVRLVTNNFVQRNPLARNAIHDAMFDRAFDRFLKEERPDLVHVHHLAGHAFSLPRVARRRGIPIVLQVQDWWSMCARVNLFRADWQRCGGPSLSKCAQCAPLTRIAPAPLWNRALHLVRMQAARSSLAAADAYVMGSQFIHDDYQRLRLFQASTRAFVLPYGVDVESLGRRRRRRDGALRFGIIGSVLPHKGLHVAAAAFRGIDRNLATLHIWGNAAASPEYTAMLSEQAGGSLTFEGRFAEEEKERIFERLDVLLVPSVGLESFGLAAREALARGVPVIAANDGALSELFLGSGGGTLFPNGDAKALEAIVRNIVERPALLDEWAAQIVPPKSVDTHAEEIEAVYEYVMGRR